MNSEGPLFAKLFTFQKGRDQEVEALDVHGLHQKHDFIGISVEISWTNQQPFNTKKKSKPRRTWQRRWDIAVLELGSRYYEAAKARTQAEVSE